MGDNGVKGRSLSCGEINRLSLYKSGDIAGSLSGLFGEQLDFCLSLGPSGRNIPESLRKVVSMVGLEKNGFKTGTESLLMLLILLY
jgi:hypothetical protein